MSCFWNSIVLGFPEKAASGPSCLAAFNRSIQHEFALSLFELVCSFVLLDILWKWVSQFKYASCEKVLPFLFNSAVWHFHFVFPNSCVMKNGELPYLTKLIDLCCFLLFLSYHSFPPVAFSKLEYKSVYTGQQTPLHWNMVKMTDWLPELVTAINNVAKVHILFNTFFYEILEC